MISKQIIKFDLQILTVSEYGMISLEPRAFVARAFVGPSHECTVSAAASNLDFGT
ncbi:hypothetical protein SLEP1_g24307 [Rubroshorea leprosula]|uniref:Uncharacterized protein n=1 Tax=Rubroshorea leprosula TaxID=152421 RepID=A0AAV5JNZ4_9ROSI|nr:hypothetical protein SLEP1_g24307 [Rubroshorea leprosula]